MSDPSDVERWARAAAWSGGDRLSAVQTVLWRSERHPAQSSTSVLVIELDAVPDWDRFVAAHAWAAHLVVRLRQRIVEPALPTTTPVWSMDEAFDLDRHLSRAIAPDRAAALELIAVEAVRPLDRDRPLWEVLLVACEEDQRALVSVKIHHALADPVGTVQLLSLLQSRTREHLADKPVVPPSVGAAAIDPVSLATQGVLRDLTRLPARSATLAREGAYAATHPRAIAGSGLRYAASLRRLVGRTPAAASPLLAGRAGEEWHFVTASGSLAALREAAAAGGGSLADAGIAVLLGAVRRYHAAHDSFPAELPVGVRVSLDRADDPGNRYAAAMIAAPVGIEDPVDRIAAVRGEVLSLHTERALEAFAAFAPLANRLPASVGASVLASGAAADAATATLAGPTRTTYLAGAEVTGIWSFGPLPGTAMSSTLLSYADTACLGVNVDAAAVEDLPLFRLCLEEGLAEVLAAR